MNNKKVLFDLTAAQPSFGSVRHGGGKYGEIILKRIVERGLSIICFYDGNRWFNPDIKSLLENHKIKLYDNSKLDLTEIIRESGANILYSALPTNAIMQRTAS